MNTSSYTKKLCMTELQASFTHFCQGYAFDATAGKNDSIFTFVEQGSATIQSMHNTLSVSEGSLFYIPSGLRHHIIWNGNPEIKYYSFQIISRKYDLPTADYNPLQLVKPLSTPETCELFKKIYHLLSTEVRIDQINALALYYQFYAQAFPLLQSEPPIKHSPSVLAAIEYIEEHYAENITAEQLAEFCHISTSALYRQFRKELHTSPVRLLNEIRVEKAARALRQTNASITDIALDNGFSSSTYFFEIFKNYTGLTPSHYRKTMNV